MRTTTRATMLLMTCIVVTVLVNVPLGGQGRGAPEGAAAAPDHKEEFSETFRGSQRNNVEYQKVAPFKMFDNLYYVGPGYVSVFLIPTTQGLILVDTAEEPYVDHVIDGIRKSGFDPKDIKYLILSHAHLDHIGGATKILELSGARVVSSDLDWPLIEAIGTRPGRGNTPPPKMPKRDMTVKDGETLVLGNTTLTFYVMGGHTPGSLSVAFTVLDGGMPRKAFLFGGPGPRGGVEGAEQFLASAKRLSQFQGVQVAAQVHSWLNDYHYPNGGLLERARTLAQRKPGEPNPFVDTASWGLWVKQVQAGAEKNLADEKQKAAK